MNPQWYTQNLTDAKDETAARAVLAALTEQDDYQGGRLLPPAGLGHWAPPGALAPTGWRVQTFHADCGAENATGLPDGLRRVCVPQSQRVAMGLPVGAS